MEVIVVDWGLLGCWLVVESWLLIDDEAVEILKGW